MAMPAALGASASTRVLPPSSRLTQSYFLPSGVDCVLAWGDNGGAQRVTDLQFNGTNMSTVTVARSSAFTVRSAAMFSASLPASNATYEVVVVYSGTPAINPCNFMVQGFSGVSQGAVDAVSVLNISFLDPVSTASHTPVASGTLLVQAVQGIDLRTLTAWSSGQSTLVADTGRFLSVLTGPAGGSEVSMNLNLSSSHAQGTSIVISLAGTDSGGGVVGTSTALRASRRRRR